MCSGSIGKPSASNRGESGTDRDGSMTPNACRTYAEGIQKGCRSPRMVADHFPIIPNASRRLPDQKNRHRNFKTFKISMPILFGPRTLPESCRSVAEWFRIKCRRVPDHADRMQIHPDSPNWRIGIRSASSGDTVLMGPVSVLEWNQGPISLNNFVRN